MQDNVYVLNRHLYYTEVQVSFLGHEKILKSADICSGQKIILYVM